MNDTVSEHQCNVFGPERFGSKQDPGSGPQWGKTHSSTQTSLVSSTSPLPTDRYDGHV